MLRSNAPSPLSLLARVLSALCLATVHASGALAQRSDHQLSPAEVRALGRLERAEMAPMLRTFLRDESPEVRAEAANALAQLVWPLVRGERGAGDSAAVAEISSALRSRLGTERDPAVLASIAMSLGRLPYRRANEARAAERLIAGLVARQRDSVIVTGAARGLESLVRIAGRGYSPAARTITVLRSHVRRAHGESESAQAGVSSAWSRRLAMMTLISARAPDSVTIRSAMNDADPQLRRLAALAAGILPDTSLRQRLLRALLVDRASIVRTEAVRAWSRIPGIDCEPLLRAARDSAPHVSLTAIDAIGSACQGPSKGAAGRVLDELVSEGIAIPAETGSTLASRRLAMHRSAHALVSLAQVMPARAEEHVSAAAASTAWQLRVYAARTAAVLADTALLERLAVDDFPNVRTEALRGLSKLVGHAADSVYIGALSAADYQLVLTAAQALRGTPHTAPATGALLASLARISAEKRETSRDPRLAILGALGQLDSADLAEGLMPYLRDFDPVIADSAASLVSRWAGREYRAAPQPLPVADRPLHDPESFRHARVRVSMAESAGGGTFELRLFADEAAATVSRFVRLVRSGYYNGLTVHRVVPNFVVQGGSPGANEYMGDGPFMRDEVGLRSHERGTVGISTRGRDTGDAQFFVNLVDNPRLDHEYTVFAEVVSGMTTVDQLLEGDVMQRVEIIMER